MNSYEGEQLGRFIHEDRLREVREERLVKKAILSRERKRTSRSRLVKNLLMFFNLAIIFKEFPLKIRPALFRINRY